MSLKAKILCVILFPSSLAPTQFQAKEFIVWNVGQGSWATIVNHTQCLHFDMGGEKAPFDAIEKTCVDKENLIFYSHWDWDHIAFTQKARKILPKLCVAAIPGGPAKKSKKRQLKKIPKCKDWPEEVQEIHFSPDRSSKKSWRTPNAYSRVFTWNNIFLISGDSPVIAEKMWSQKLQSQPIKWFLLGHHGSHTSNCKELFSSLPKLVGTVSSSRRKRYNHPHPKVLAQLKKRKLPVITTEDWGHLRFQLEPL